MNKPTASEAQAMTTIYRCFGCDRITRDESKVRIGADGYLHCDECRAYEARTAAQPAPVCEWDRSTDDVQDSHGEMLCIHCRATVARFALLSLGV